MRKVADFMPGAHLDVFHDASEPSRQSKPRRITAVDQCLEVELEAHGWQRTARSVLSLCL